MELLSDLSQLALTKEILKFRRGRRWLVVSSVHRLPVLLDENRLMVFGSLGRPVFFGVFRARLVGESRLSIERILGILKEFYFAGLLSIDGRVSEPCNVTCAESRVVSLPEWQWFVGGGKARLNQLLSERVAPLDGAKLLSISDLEWILHPADLLGLMSACLTVLPGSKFVVATKPNAWDSDTCREIAQVLQSNRSRLSFEEGTSEQQLSPLPSRESEELLESSSSATSVQRLGCGDSRCVDRELVELLRGSDTEMLGIVDMTDLDESVCAQGYTKRLLDGFLSWHAAKVACLPLAVLCRPDQCSQFYDACVIAGYRSVALTLAPDASAGALLSDAQQVAWAEAFLSIIDKSCHSFGETGERVRIHPLERICSCLAWGRKGLYTPRLEWCDVCHSGAWPKETNDDCDGGACLPSMNAAKCSTCFFSCLCGKFDRIRIAGALEGGCDKLIHCGLGGLCAFWRTLGEGLLWRLVEREEWAKSF